MSLSACDFKDLAGAGKKDPANEATVIGTWRSNYPAPGGNTDIKVTMRIDPDHTLVLSQRMANPGGPEEFVELSRETGSWSLQDGSFKSSRTACEYSAAPDYKLKPADCKLPLEKEIPVQVTGGAWTILEEGKPIVFRKD